MGPIPRKSWPPGKRIVLSCTGAFLLFVVAPCTLLNAIGGAYRAEMQKEQARATPAPDDHTGATIV